LEEDGRKDKKGQTDVVEDVSNYWIIFRKGQDNGS